MLGLVAGCTEKVTSTVAVNSPDYSTLPEKKQTKLGLYLTAAEAYDNWKADPENIVVLDVRTPEEYIFVGHPEMAWNVPFKIATCETVDGQPGLVMKTTPDFIERAKKVVKPTDTIYVICRSGGRSAAVVNLLAEKGFKNAYNIIDGFEGDKVKDPKNANHGKRAINGWRNAGRPWTYDLVPEKMLLPAEILKPEAPKTE
jgi:rhodanese-related sulfurtransferase